MKSRVLFFITATAALIGFQQVHADTLDADRISISGSIIQETGSNGKTTVKPITIPNLLNVLGLSGSAAPKTLRYYYDEAGNGSYVIAPKGTAVGGSGTPLATILTYSNGVSWTPTKHSGISASTSTGLNDNLSGDNLERGVFPGQIETDTTTFTLFGTISGIQTVVKGTIVDTYPENEP